MVTIKRFAVAVSFPGEHRRFVRKVAALVAKSLGKKRVFFDEWYAAEIHGTGVDLKLKRIYRNEAVLVVPFFSKHYAKRWCQIEWHAIRAILAERRGDDAVVPVHLDDTLIEGWESIDVGIRKGRKTANEIAGLIVGVYRQRERASKQRREPSPDFPADAKLALRVVRSRTKSHAIELPRRKLKRAIEQGALRDSSVAPIVLLALTKEPKVAPIHNPDRDWVNSGIRLSDEYLVRVLPSAGKSDWQRDFAQVATPTLVGMARSLERSPNSQTLVIRLCDSLAKLLRLRIVWPKQPDKFHNAVNSIYEACMGATDLECDRVLDELRQLKMIGPK